MKEKTLKILGVIKEKEKIRNKGLVKNVKSKKPKKSPKEDRIVKMKKGGKEEEIPDNNTFAKLRSKMVNRKEDTNEDTSHGNEGQSDEENTIKGKAKWSFPTKKNRSSSKKKKVEYTDFTVVKMGYNKCTGVSTVKVDTMIIYIGSTK